MLSNQDNPIHSHKGSVSVRTITQIRIVIIPTHDLNTLTVTRVFWGLDTRVSDYDSIRPISCRLQTRLRVVRGRSVPVPLEPTKCLPRHAPVLVWGRSLASRRLVHSQERLLRAEGGVPNCVPPLCDTYIGLTDPHHLRRQFNRRMILLWSADDCVMRSHNYFSVRDMCHSFFQCTVDTLSITPRIRSVHDCRLIYNRLVFC